MKAPALAAALLSAALASRATDAPAPAAAAPPQYPIPIAGAATADGLGFNDPAHVEFWRYQVYLKNKGLGGLDAAAWAALGAEVRAGNIRRDEETLRANLDRILRVTYINSADEDLLKSVWGPEVLSAAQRVLLARTQDPSRLRDALAQVQTLTRSASATLREGDWSRLFDGQDYDPLAVTVPDAAGAPQAPPNFLDRIESPAVRDALASEQAFRRFLESRSVPAQVTPALLAMYRTLSSANASERAEVGHLLPTVVAFLAEGKQIRMQEHPGAYAFVQPGDYDQPDFMGVTPDLLAMGNDQLIGDVLAHEFQHVYDMYAGRYYTLDSELRGFKVNMLYYQLLDRTAPDFFESVMQNGNDEARRFVLRERRVLDSFQRGADAFAQEVAFPVGYSNWSEGVFYGRMPLVEAVREDFGAPRELAAQRASLAALERQIARLEAQIAEVDAELNRAYSLALDRRRQRHAADLRGLRTQQASLRGQIDLAETRIRRMRAERAWMERRDPGARYDLSLAVDRNYYR